MRSALLVALVGGMLLPAADAGAASPTRCNKTHGTELAHSAVVKVYKVKTGASYRFYGCAKPRGPVIALTQPFRGTAVKLVAAKGAYVAFTRTISGKDTIAVVDARTGKKRHGLYPPRDIEFDIDPRTPQIGAARVNSRGELAVAYIGLGEGSTTESTVYIYAFDRNYNEQLLDSGTSSKLIATSIRLSGEDVSWTNDDTTRTAKIGEVPLSVTAGGGPTAGDVTTSPEGGIACHIATAGLTGNCIGSFAPNAYVTVTATGAPTATVTISGGCSAVHAPVAGQASSVATCNVRMSSAKSVRVTFSRRRTSAGRHYLAVVREHD
ncbi:MAG: hypothetical protein QOD24_3114 [Solirubrobacteraceae bacterium]|nr:hypothetical protein [Solirubrobacteraceae bacterium]